MIASLQLLSIVNAILLGVLLYLGDSPVSTIPTVLLTIIFTTTFLLYPKAKRRLTSKKYRQQKLCDFTLVLSGALFLAFSVSNFLATPSVSHLVLEEEIQPVVLMAALGQANESVVLASPTKAEIRKTRRSQIKELKATIKAWKKEHKGDRKTSKFGQIMLIVLVIMGAVLAGLAVAALSCSLACSGAEGLAIIVMLAGVGGIILLSVVLIKNIIGANGPPARPVQHS
ncbi:hypothetical protein [Neolewinella persica]|uniref:hypothetical protein n=1 Tax=Neolewinella persica TaxID=70998 RepID=UPI0012FC85CF|nr:hypothetical protein [Neolewinella persica]